MQIKPYVSDRRKKRRRRRAYLFTALGILALYAVFFVVQWFIFHSPVFRVDQVVVTGSSDIASSDVVALVQASALPKHVVLPAVFTFNNMLLWPDRVATSDLALIPELASVTVSKDYFSHTVTIDATERQADGIWCFSNQPGAVSASVSASSTVSATGAKSGASTVTINSNALCYWFDDAGTLFEKSFNTQGNIIYVVDDSAQSPKGLNQQVLPPEFLSNFLSIMDVLHEANLAVQSIQLTDLGLEQVDVHTANGPTIYFSLRFPADEYLAVIQKLMLQSNFNKLQYIDCTTQNRLYYK